MHQVPRRFLLLGPQSLTLAGDGGLGGTVVSGAPGAQEVVGARWRWRWRCGWPGQHLPRGSIPAAAHGDPEGHVRAEARWPATRTGTGTRGARGLRGPLVRVRLGHLAVHGAGPGRAGLLGRGGTAEGQLEQSDPIELQARVRADHLSPGIPHPVPTYPITPIIWCRVKGPFSARASPSPVGDDPGATGDRGIDALGAGGRGSPARGASYAVAQPARHGVCARQAGLLGAQIP